MGHTLEFWKLEHLPDVQLIESLHAVIRTKRRALAELIAHLGEVEERRLHLLAAHSSMFDYCVSRLNMSEDEACRRIELARLARRFPALFSLLATGEISLSVALLLKPMLTPNNHVELLNAARGVSMRQTRELLAARFPSPDVSSSARKLPERRAMTEPTCEEPRTSPRAEPQEAGPHPAPDTSPPPNARTTPAAPLCAPTPHPQTRIEPLSSGRYKIQFTADAALKEKLELARDLLRHAHPAGDFGPVVSRALDLLIADLQRRRFGIGARPKAPKPPRHPKGSSARAPTPPTETSSFLPYSVAIAPSEPCSPPPSTADSSPMRAGSVPRAERRAVIERDGLACTWVDADGSRCASRAWLELDHRHPRAKAGSSEANNLRLLCRAHNQLAAELEFGRAHMERARAGRRQHRSETSSPCDAATATRVP